MLPSFLFGQEDFEKELRRFWKEHQTGLQQKFDGPLKPRDLKALDYFPPSPKWRVQAKLRQADSEQTLELPTSAQRTKTYRIYGYLEFEVDGQNFQVPVYQYLGMGANTLLQDHLFLPFTDLTNGESTYGGGRYIDLTISGIRDGTMIVDFNRAYNPYCAYADGWNCPIPPRENFMEIAVEAGEKNYVGKRRKRK